MFFLSLLLAFTATISPIHAANSVIFTNHCPYDLFAWTVGPAGSGYAGEDRDAVTLPAQTITTHAMVKAAGGGISLKLRDLPFYRVAPAGILQVEYNLLAGRNELWYDLSAIDCEAGAGPESSSFCPLVQSGVRVHVERADRGRFVDPAECPSAGCGAQGCYNTYRQHGTWKGEPTFKCGAGSDIVVELCTERAGPRTFHGLVEPEERAGKPDGDVKPGGTTTDGICGAKAVGGATCFGFRHGNCCSEYGWCGFSELHCGAGCQSSFGDCFGQSTAISSSSSMPVEHSSVPSSGYMELTPTSTYHAPVSSDSSPGLSYSAPLSSYYGSPPNHTVYATLTVTETVYRSPTHGQSEYSAPTTSEVHNTPTHKTTGYGAPRTSTVGYGEPKETGWVYDEPAAGV